MNFATLAEAGPVIQIHAAAAILAVVIGPLAFLRHRRDRVHKILGHTWVTAMMITAVSALFIFEIRLWGPFSPIYLLSFLVFWNLWRAITKIRQGDVAGHRGKC
ncbi:MAG: putative membrane protein [Paracoccaceae bacterium]